MSRDRSTMLIAASANVSQRTVRRYLDGDHVLPIVKDAIHRAAKELKIALGPLRRNKSRKKAA